MHPLALGEANRLPEEQLTGRARAAELCDVDRPVAGIEPDEARNRRVLLVLLPVALAVDSGRRLLGDADCPVVNRVPQ